MAIAALVLGIIGLVAWLIPILGLPITIVGLIMGVNGRRKNPEQKGMATAGMIMSIIGLILTIINGAVGACMGLMYFM